MRKDIKIKGFTVIACIIITTLVVYFTGTGQITPTLAIGLFTALSIVTLERTLTLFEMMFNPPKI